MSVSTIQQLQLPIEQVSKPAYFGKNKFTFVDLFAGIGGFRIPLENLGGQCLAFSEVDKEAIKVYYNNFINCIYANDEIDLGDITKVTTLPNNIDVVVGGVPCQPWSVAGALKGFDDPRGKLWFDVIRLIDRSKPKSFIFENVRGLASPKNRKNLDFLLAQFTSIGYCVKFKVINAYDFGLPQNRERVFIVGIRKNLENSTKYQFPEPLNVHPKIISIFKDEVQIIDAVSKTKLDAKTLFQGSIPPSRTRFQKDDELNDFFIFSDLRNGHTTIHSWDIIKTTSRQKEICLQLLKNRRSKKYGEKDGNPLSYQDLKALVPNLEIEELDRLIAKRILKEIIVNNIIKYEFVNSKNMSGINGIYRIILPTADVVPTLTATGAKDFIATRVIAADNPQDYKKLFLRQIYQKRRFKPITAENALLLQGFPRYFRYHQNEDIAKKQFGNAVPIPVVEHITKQLLKIILG
jgi:DNA (cytosine-5)-methyltransferase 1